MIVPMSKVFLVVRGRDRDQLLKMLRELGMVHLVPVDPGRAVADESLKRQVDMLKRSLQVLSGVKSRQPAPALAPLDAAQEVMDIERRAAEGRSHLAALYHQLDELELWGDLRLEHIDQLRRTGIQLSFYSLPAAVRDKVVAECSAVVRELPGRQVLVAVATRGQEPSLPEGAVPVPLPPRDASSVREEAKQIDAALHQDLQRLHQLAGLIPRMHTELARLDQQMEEMVAVRGAAGDQHLFALQGWLPEESVDTLRQQLAQQHIPVALEVMEPAADEEPPTLVRPPAWARSIEGLFQMLGTIPGYREFDISVPFLIALPIFTAMLISDGGYGALLLLVLGLGYRPVSRAIGARFTQLMLIVGAVSLVWGILANAFFGYPLMSSPIIAVDQSEASRTFMMRLSFTIGALHLSLAQLWQAVRLWPDLRVANKVGWGLFVWGMYGVVVMFVLKGPMGWHTPWPYLLLAGAALAIVFAEPSRNIGKMLLLGVAQFPLSMLSTFSDVISYVRLMAVGLASGVLAVSFNNMAADAAWPLAILIFLFGHSLNIGLAMIAMFAHGVRLNMLEFSNNLGMRWTGFPYQPFTQRSIQEHT